MHSEDSTQSNSREPAIVDISLQAERLLTEQPGQPRQPDQSGLAMAAQLAASHQALATLNREFEQLAYTISHDLKAPLRGIVNLAGWIEEDLGASVTPGVKEQLTMLGGQVRRLEALIDGILAFSRAGRLFEKAVLVDMHALVSEVVERALPPVGVEVEIVGPLPSFMVERRALEQVFTHLIKNAIVHGCAGGGRVRVSAQDEKLVYRFSVQDLGPGIAPVHHERIFGMFQTLVPRDKVEGAGVGLSLVKKLVDTRGGTIQVESLLGEGATFSFTWPKQARLERG